MSANESKPKQAKESKASKQSSRQGLSKGGRSEPVLLPPPFPLGPSPFPAAPAAHQRRGVVSRREISAVIVLAVTTRDVLKAPSRLTQG